MPHYASYALHKTNFRPQVFKNSQRKKNLWEDLVKHRAKHANVDNLSYGKHAAVIR